MSELAVLVTHPYILRDGDKTERTWVTFVHTSCFGWNVAIGSMIKDTSFELVINLTGGHREYYDNPWVMDAIRIEDETPVMLKLIDPNELTIGNYFLSEPLISDPANHCTAILGTIQFPYDDRKIIIVMPLLRPIDEPRFDTIGEIVAFFDQIFEGVAFMHKNYIAHRDCARLNIMMDGRPLYSEPWHPRRPHKALDFRRTLNHYTRTQRPVKYYLIDFGISKKYEYYDPKSAPILERHHPGLDRSLPEWKNGMVDPFAADVYYIGHMIHETFLEGTRRTHGLEFMGKLIKKMIDPEPKNRPKMSDVVKKFTKLSGKLSSWKLRSHPGSFALVLSRRMIPPSGFSGQFLTGAVELYTSSPEFLLYRYPTHSPPLTLVVAPYLQSSLALAAFAFSAVANALPAKRIVSGNVFFHLAQAFRSSTFPWHSQAPHQSRHDLSVSFKPPPTSHSSPITSVKSFVDLSTTLEAVDSTAYTGAAQLIDNKAFILTLLAYTDAMKVRLSSLFNDFPIISPFITLGQLYRAREQRMGHCIPDALLSQLSVLARRPLLQVFPQETPRLPLRAHRLPDLSLFAVISGAGAPVFVLIKDNQVTIPDTLCGLVFCVIMRDGGLLPDSTTVARPAILNFAFDSTDKSV
ncbi:kinase-like domain-containing protein [Mycena rebaudengoi]|nr:kinase-like domain-containing protein [Mycena rebaudengoi]